MSTKYSKKESRGLLNMAVGMKDLKSWQYVILKWIDFLVDLHFKVIKSIYIFMCELDEQNANFLSKVKRLNNYVIFTNSILYN